MAASMRVRNSPFGASGPGGQGPGPAAPGMAVQPPGQGLSAAPTPPAPAAGQLPPGSQVDFDSWDSGWGEAQQAQQPMQQQPQQPMHQQPQQPMQQQPGMQMPGQMQPQPGMQAGGMQQAAMQQAGAAMFSAGMGAMGMGGGPMGDFNNAMAGAALNQLQNQLQMSGMARWFPTLFLSAQQLFSVSHSYVLRKMLVLMCPFVKRGQGAPSTPSSPWGGQQQGQQGPQVGEDGLMVDIEDPDLYIPLMSYVTYVLLYAVQRGIFSDFRPEVLSSTLSFALVLLILEVGAFSMGFYFLNNPVPTLKITAICGYKYAPVLMMVLFRIITGSSPIYYVFFAYLSACAAWSCRRFMLHFEPSELKEQYGVPTSNIMKHVILGMAAVQVPLCWLLTPYSS